jgi:hypothetical protein
LFVASIGHVLAGGAQAPTATSAAQAATAEAAEFFEKKIRPVLATRCFGCHSSKLASPKGELVLDTKAGLAKGGHLGAAVLPGKPDESLLIRALEYGNEQLQMPPSGKLPDQVIADFRAWIAAGAVDPRADVAPNAAASRPLRGMSLADGRKWWSFQPVSTQALPKVKDARWPKTRIDNFILAKLEEKGVAPSATADKRTLITRAYVDLVGFKPSYEEVQAFLKDSSPNAYATLIERLLASPHYGERWARLWMDVVRYGEDNPTSEGTNPPYPYAWRYRDWIIEALNNDVPYDQFVKMQLAADKMPGTTRSDLRALGFLGAAPVYHKDQKLSAEVIGTFLADDFDDRIDTVTRGIMGVTVSCARCHDHKFDPISHKDYYALQGVFASTMRIERSMFDVDPAIEARYMWVQRRLFDLNYAANNLASEASTVDNAPDKVTKWMAEIRALKAEMEALLVKYPELAQSLERLYAVTRREMEGALPKDVADRLGIPTVAGRQGGPPVPNAVQNANQANQAQAAARGRRGGASNAPFMNVVFDAANYVDGSDKDYTFIRYVPDEPRDVPLLKAGNVAAPGEIVPRGFPVVLSKGDNRFTQGSGRLELANKIFTDAQGLTARVIVNRVWGWHFGEPLVATPSDFGTQGHKPTHPELLDDLAARFIENGWSFKWLHRELMGSATYQQASRWRADAAKVNEENDLLWRMRPRRLDAEAYRDTLLRSAGTLNLELGGPSQDLDDPMNSRRTIYARISRGRASAYLGLFDFPEAMQSSPKRETTTTALQQLYIMNSPFARELSVATAKSVANESDAPAKVRALFRKVLARDPTPDESRHATEFLKTGTIEHYAHVLLSTNEEIFWP